MRRTLLALALVALLPAAGTAGSLLADPEPAERVELSHGFFVPFMHLGALDIPTGVRPGAWLQIGGSDCTASFVLEDGAGDLYITTAGHCTQALGQRVRVTEGDMVAALGAPKEFGTLVAHWPNGLDAALIKVDADKQAWVSPTMTGWGGPTGLVTGPLPEGTGVRHYGWGWVTWYEQQTRCRVGTLEGVFSNTWWYNGIGGGGDSGSAVMTEDGLALGILDWGGGVIVPTPTGAFASTQMGGVRLDRVIDRWNAQGWDLSLVLGGPVNPVCVPEPPVPGL